MNDTERKNWVMNDEGLYMWWQDSRMSLTEFVRRNRKDIDNAIDSVLHPQEGWRQDYWRARGF